jgi:hypothetical protein
MNTSTFHGLVVVLACFFSHVDVFMLCGTARANRAEAERERGGTCGLTILNIQKEVTTKYKSNNDKSNNE